MQQPGYKLLVFLDKVVHAAPFQHYNNLFAFDLDKFIFATRYHRYDILFVFVLD